MGPASSTGRSTDENTSVAGVDASRALVAAEEARRATQPAFISVLSADAVASFAASAPNGSLAGIPFAIKDNLDLVGSVTTAADPRRVTPAEMSAHVVRLLTHAGAVPIAKTNLDQYATGLVGTRTPYGACHSIASVGHISGGSSSGSAVAVATGIVPFALATDTAGSGRVPAAFNGIVGLKPSRGLLSTRGLLPACRSLDCVTVMARDVATTRRVFDAACGLDPLDPRSRNLPATAVRLGGRRATIGVPRALPPLEPAHLRAWQDNLDLAAGRFDVVEVDVDALLEAATLLYDGPWLAERYLAFGAYLDDDPAVDTTVRSIVLAGKDIPATAAFAGFDRLAELGRRAAAVWETIDALLLPVTPLHPLIDEVRSDPIRINSRLGTFTNMTNLLDLAGIAVPGSPRDDGLPFGVQFLAPAFSDHLLLDVADVWCGLPPDASDTVDTTQTGPSEIALAVAGAHLSGQPLNDELISRGGRLLRTTRTANGYRMFEVPGTPARPGITRLPALNVTEADSLGIEVEVWALPQARLASFAATIAAPLAIGPLTLVDGSTVLGFVCTADAVDQARDITTYGSWRRYLGAPH